MLGMLDFLMDPQMREWIQQERQAAKKRRMAAAVPWTPDTKCALEVNLQAHTYDLGFDPFPEVQPVRREEWVRHWRTHPQVARSPGETFCFVKQTPPAGAILDLYGRKGATVLFDGPISVPTLFEPATSRGFEAPWMSLTPAEVISLRAGTRRAKGHTIVAGLGLGYQLWQVSLRKQVKKLTLVEQSRELVDWILPRLGIAMPIEVVVGDAYEVIPKMTADVCLLDIFPGYGFNAWDAEKITRHSPSIKSFWVWGAGRSGKDSIWD